MTVQSKIVSVHSDVAEINLGKLSAHDLSSPIAIKSYKEYEPTDLVGMGPNTSKLHVYVSQGHAGYTYNIPLVSEGFGPCWAAIIYDRNTSRSIMLHVDDYETKWNQQAKIERHFSLPSDGAREAVIVKSNYRTHASSRSEEYFRRIGCSTVRTLEADSGGMHWSISYSPDENIIYVVTKHKGEGSKATQYIGFSTNVYDQEMRAQHGKEAQLHSIIEALEFFRHHHKKWLEINGHFDQNNFNQFLNIVRKQFPELGTTQEVRALLINNKLAFESEDKLVVPSMFHWAHESVSKPIYARVHDKPFATLRIYDDQDLAAFRFQIAEKFNGPKTVHRDKNFIILDSAKGGEEIILYFASSNEICFHTKVEGEFLRETLAAISSIINENTYRLNYTVASTSYDNKAPAFTAKQWSSIKEQRKLLAELGID